ncbi:GHKL domain-containing protein [candidate division WOR-3 bacterium]|nr:GHKL domain-containing protein [candidate division WOR-3 bacterium]
MNKEQRRILNEEIARMRSVMDLLKSISTTKIEKKEIVISDIINESISLLHNMIMEKNVNLQKNIDEKIEIRGNRTLLITALSNLVKNCIEADAKNVFINAVQKGNILNIEVVDDGSGINSKIIGNIFEPFFSNKNQSGLGLYLVKKIIEVHGGEIKVESNKKTIFKISLLIK